MRLHALPVSLTCPKRKREHGPKAVKRTAVCLEPSRALLPAAAHRIARPTRPACASWAVSCV
eukprot:1522590-Prymnesium_polylepis.1